MSYIISNPYDTFGAIARRNYGDHRKADLIKSANPGVDEPIIAGTAITIPPEINTEPDQSPSPSRAKLNKITLKINGKLIELWTEIRIKFSLDSMDTVELTAPHNPGDPVFRASFKPLKFSEVTVAIDGVVIFTGTLMFIDPDVSTKGRTIHASCYSRPGVLADCTPPASYLDKLQWDDTSLQIIAEKLAEPFGIKVVFNAKSDIVIKRIALNVGDKIFPILVKLAQPRGLIIGNTPSGDLLFDRPAKTGAPVANLVEGEPPFLSAKPSLNPQEYYSSITGIEPTIVKVLKGEQLPIRNPHLNGVVRPLTYTVDDVDATGKNSVHSKMGRMFANVVSYNLILAGWRDENGNLWAPNTTVNIYAPGAMVYSPYEFLIRNVILSRSIDNGEVTELALVLPGVFDSKIPKVLPWD